MIISIIIRTLNEEKYLRELIKQINIQKQNYSLEIIIVDSGSTDNTLEIAKQFKTTIIHISKEEFSFGRSLNKGCKVAKGEILIFISGHCIPYNTKWLKNLIFPIIQNKAVYTYGRQIEGEKSKFSEKQLFCKYFSKKSRIPQKDFFCNNANAALKKSIWEKYHFDEELTGLEDMALAKKIYHQKYHIAYVAEAIVIHNHEETWTNIKRRYEREAIALQKIMPEIHLSLFDVLRYFWAGIFLDFSVALQERKFFRNVIEIFLFRFMQFWGAYKGNHEHRKLSKKQKELYFYPNNKKKIDFIEINKNRESK